MQGNTLDSLWKQIRLLLKAHPWHGIPIGEESPDIVTAYIEIVPSDTVKYEIDKFSGILKIDRPQKYSNICPTLYGFIPQTYSGEKVAEFCREKTGRKDIIGDKDPVDICVLSEKSINHGNFLLQAIPIGGLRMIDGNEADDKLIAVMKDDATFGAWRDISECTDSLIERLRHYFLTYKDAPGATPRRCEITQVYGSDEAKEVIKRSYEDYLGEYGEINELLVAER